MPTATLSWVDANSGARQEDEIRIYRAEAPFDAGTLPAILATLPADATTYDDDTITNFTSYWYAVAMVKDSTLAIAFSDEVAVAIGEAGFSNADYYVVTCSGPDKGAHQGVITLADGWILIYDNTFSRFNSNWVLQATNANPNAAMGTSGNQIDMFAADGFIWTVRGNIHKFNATTLAYDSAVTFTPGPNFIGFSAVSAGPVSGYLYGVNQNATAIEVHDRATGNFIEEIPIGGTLVDCNGMHFQDGYFYFAERPDDLRRCSATGGDLESVLTTGFTGMDGASGGEHFLDILMDNSWSGLLRVNAIFGDVAQTTGESSGEIVVNGDAETTDVSGWLNNSDKIVNIFSAAFGSKPDSRVFRGGSGSSFMYQSIIFPQEGWDSVDAGTATADLVWQQIGTSSGTCALTFFDENFVQIGQAYRSYIAVSFAAWVDRGGTGAAVPAGTRMVLIGVETGGTNVQIDNISAQLHW